MDYFEDNNSRNVWMIRSLTIIFHTEQWTCSISRDWGVPDRKSCQVRGDSFLYLSGGIYLKTHQFAVLFKYIRLQYIIS